jgi:hypothetical protein
MSEEHQNHKPEDSPECADQQPEMRPAQLDDFVSGLMMDRLLKPSILGQTV